MKIELRGYHYTCGEPGCCDDYGTDIYIDGEMIGSGYDEGTILTEVLKHLGYKFTILETYEDSEGSI